MADIVLTVKVTGLENGDKANIAVEAVSSGGGVNGDTSLPANKPDDEKETGGATTSGGITFVTADFKVVPGGDYRVTVTPALGDWFIKKSVKTAKAVTVDPTNLPFQAEAERFVERTKFNKDAAVEIEMTRLVLDLCKTELENLASKTPGPTGKDVHELQKQFKNRFKGLV